MPPSPLLLRRSSSSRSGGDTVLEPRRCGVLPIFQTTTPAAVRCRCGGRIFRAESDSVGDFPDNLCCGQRTIAHDGQHGWGDRSDPLPRWTQPAKLERYSAFDKIKRSPRSHRSGEHLVEFGLRHRGGKDLANRKGETRSAPRRCCLGSFRPTSADIPIAETGGHPSPEP